MGIALKNFSRYEAFIEENQSFLDSIRAQVFGRNPIEMGQLKRDLHNLKGTLSLYAFSNCVSILQKIEDSVSETRAEANKMLWRPLVSQLSNQYEKDLHDLNEVSGAEGNSGRVSIGRAPASRFFEKYQRYLNILSKNSGNSGQSKRAQLHCHPDCCELGHEEVQHLDKVFAHIFRNSFDHGIETVSDRMDLGKSAEGKIEVLCTRAPEDGLIFTISDDGRGIRTDQLAAMAVKKKVWTQVKADSASIEEKINLIFIPEFSTQEQVSETSGRGIGMDAVKSYLVSLGGSITVRQGQVCGTQVVIKVLH